MELKEIISMVGTIVLMLAVFAGAYLVSKFVAKRYGTVAGASKNLSIIEKLSLGKDKSVLVVKAADKVFLLGSTERQLTMLCELDPEDFPNTPQDKPPVKDFRATLRDVISGVSRPAKGDND